MTFNCAKLRVKELAELLSVDPTEIIVICTLMKIPASSAISSISVDNCKKIIDYLKEDN